MDRLKRPELRSDGVAESLAQWRRIAAMPRSALSSPHNDTTEFVGPAVRAHLERALLAIGRRHARPLRAAVEGIDRQFEAKTVNNPHADPAAPWWARRWWN